MLESWYTAKAEGMDNNLKLLPRQYSTLGVINRLFTFFWAFFTLLFYVSFKIFFRLFLYISTYKDFFNLSKAIDW